MMLFAGLPEKVIESIKAVFKKYQQIETVKIFGSRAIGNFKHNSDIDLAIFGEDLGIDLESKIWMDLDDLPLPYKFDVKVYDLINNENLKKHIDDYGKVFYKA